jgi:hypothetical protein
MWNFRFTGVSWSEKQKRILLTFDLDFGGLIFKRKLTATQGIIISDLSQPHPLKQEKFFQQF